MSFSNFKETDDIRLSNVFRHHFVRSLSPQEKKADSQPVSKANVSLIDEPKKRKTIKSKINEECKNFLFFYRKNK